MEGPKLLIVGAGLTGSLLATILKRTSPQVAITVWEKAKGAGGRMSTHRDPTNSALHVDMAAQYISRTKATGKNTDDERLRESLYEELLSAEVLSPFRGCIEGEKKELTAAIIVQNYASCKGLNSIAKHFLVQSGANVAFQKQVTEASVSSVASGSGSSLQQDHRPRVQVLCAAAAAASEKEGEEDQEEEFDGVVFTMPVPQLLTLKGNFLAKASEETLSNLSSVTYSSRYALGLFFEECPRQLWSAKYFDDPVVRFACWDTSKRDSSSSSSSSKNRSTLLLHTGVPFGIRHLEADKEEVKQLIVERAAELIPGLPTPTHSHILRWRYSQVQRVYPGSPGCVVLSREPLVVATGDGFSGSNFENCIRASQSAAQAVIEIMKLNPTLVQF